MFAASPARHIQTEHFKFGRQQGTVHSAGKSGVPIMIIHLEKVGIRIPSTCPLVEIVVESEQQALLDVPLIGSCTLIVSIADFLVKVDSEQPLFSLSLFYGTVES